MDINQQRRTLLLASLSLATLGAVPMVHAATRKQQETLTVSALDAARRPVDVVLPADPKRLAVADFATLDVLLHWGLLDRVVALPKAQTLPYLPQPFEKNNGILDIGTLKEVDLEALMASEPDVIFISGRLSRKYDALRKIAPVVYLATDYERGAFESFKGNLNVLGSIFGKQAAASAAIDHYAKRLKRIRRASANKTALVGLVTSAHVNLLGGRARCSLISQECGFHNIAGKANSNHGNEASFELLLELDPDYLFILDRDSAIGRPGARLAQDILDNEMVRKTRAWRHNHVVYLTPSAWYLAEGGIQAMNIMLHDVEKSLGLL